MLFVPMILMSIVLGIWFWISERSDILMSDHAEIFGSATTLPILETCLTHNSMAGPTGFPRRHHEH